MSQGYKLKLFSKKLRSGRCQIKFYVIPPEKKNSFYGYLLADPGSTLREVVQEIENQVKSRAEKKRLHHEHLYNLGQHKQNPSTMFFFTSPL